MSTNQVSNHTKKVKAEETIAKLVLKFFAGITICTLIVIVGYILYRGIVSDRKIEYDVTNKGEQAIILNDKSYTVIVNEDVRTDELVLDDVMRLFGGSRKEWGKITEQDLDVTPIFYEENTSEYDELTAMLFAGDEDKLYRKTVYVKTAQDVVSEVAKTSGSVGIVPTELTQEMPETAKPVQTRRISIIVNEEVTSVKDNVRLRFLSEDHVKSLYAGNVSNWQEVDGNNTPVVLVAMEEGTTVGDAFNQLVMNDVKMTNNVIYVDSKEAMFETVMNTSGAVGYGYYDEVVAGDGNIVPVERHEVKQNLTWSFITEPPKNSGQVGGISTIILNTIFMLILVLIISIPIGLAAAIFLTEYAKQGRLIRILRFGTETLAGIPSIIFGLFGFMFFCVYLKIGIGLLSGTLTLTLMILPTLIRTAEEAIKTVPLSYREGSLALGATKWQTIKKVVLPAAAPGILTGIILGMGRAIGETAAIIFTMGSDYRLADSLSSSARVLSIHLYFLVKEGISFEKAFATASILIVVILVINFIANQLISRMGKLQG